MDILWLFYLLSISTILMQCESSRIISNRFVRKQILSYPKHPYNHHKTPSHHKRRKGRKLLQSPSNESRLDTQLQDALDDIWSNIRITPYFDYLDDTTDADTALVLKHRVSAAIRYFEEFVKVVHTDKALRLSKTCQYITDNTYNCTTMCGDTNFVIPTEHLDSGWIVNDEDDECKVIDVDAPGLGIAETDLVVYVTNDDYRCQGRSWQSLCEQDQFGRPIAILLNFCNVKYSQDEALNDYQETMDLTMHELTHGLIFNRDYFDDFRNPINGNPIDEEYVISYLNDTFWITSPEVQKIARQHFDCDVLPGVQLDDTHYHWSGRMLNTELMNNDGYYLYLSKFTLALMMDSGWYRMDDYSYAQPFYFGYKAGCYFVYGDCIDRDYRYSVYPEFWCDSEQDIGCLYDYTRTSTQCLYDDDLHGVYIPFRYQYFGYSSIGGPPQTNYCPFLSPHHGIQCTDNNIQSDIDPTFQQSFGDSNSRCVDTNAGSACFNTFCMDWNDVEKGYDHVIINVNDGVDINANVTCYRNDEGATVNVICPENGMECLSITCPYIDIMCGDTQKPFKCYYGHYDDDSKQCLCNAGYKGDTCLNRDLGIESLQLYSSSDPILITYYHTLCIYGLQWGNEGIIQNINGIWMLQTNNISEYNPVYVAVDNDAYIIYYKHCDETWYIMDTINDVVIGKCYHNRFDWTDYGAIESCSTFWYIDHDLQGDFVRDVNVLMSSGDEIDECNVLIESVAPFAHYQYICIEEERDIYDVSGSYINDGVYNGYNSWRRMYGDDRYLSFEGASWHIHTVTAYIDDFYYICYTFDSDPISCNNGDWFAVNEYQSSHPMVIYENQCPHDNFPTAPSAPSPEPTARPTERPSAAAEVINDAVCVSHAGGSFDGTYIANGTYNERQIFIKPYLPQLNRPFVYLFYRLNGSWIVYRDIGASVSHFWFLKCGVNAFDVADCNENWITSWSGNEPIISIVSGECEDNDATNVAPTNKPTNHPITESEVNNNYICVSDTSFSNLDGSYALNGTFNDRNTFKKTYEIAEEKPFVYIKFEELHEHWDQNGVYGWIIYRKFNTQNFYFYCDNEWANDYYNQGNHKINEDPTLCNGHWITNWSSERNNITLFYGLCAKDILIQTDAPTQSPIQETETDEHYCGSIPLNDASSDSDEPYFYDSICLSNVEDESLSGIYRLNGTYNEYPSYIKEYLPQQNKPFVYIKYEDVVIGDADADGTVDTRRQWIVYREYCAQSYYLYCQHTVNSMDINECSGDWHTSWSGIEVNITSSNDITACNNNEMESVLPDAICMSSTGTETLNGRYDLNGSHNGYRYYKKEYVLNESVYIFYSNKWMIFSDLMDDTKYFLECDASIDSMDVTECTGKWKGDPFKTPSNVGSKHCIEQSTDILTPSLHNERNRRQIIIALLLFSVLLLLCFIWCFVCKQRSAAKHKFDRIHREQTDDDDDDDNDDNIESVDVNDDGIGGGFKQTKHSNKLTHVFRKITSLKQIESQSEENVELVSSSNNHIDDDNIDEDIDDIDEFTSELHDNDDDYDDDEEEEDALNLHNDRNNNDNDNAISYVSPHNRLEID